MNWQFNLNYFEILKATSEVWMTKAFLLGWKVEMYVSSLTPNHVDKSLKVHFWRHIFFCKNRKFFSFDYGLAFQLPKLRKEFRFYSFSNGPITCTHMGAIKA